MNRRLRVRVGMAAGLGFIFVVVFLFIQTNRISAEDAAQTKAASKKPVPIQVPESTARAIEKDPKTAAKLIPGLANTPYLQKLIKEQQAREIADKENQKKIAAYNAAVAKETITESLNQIMKDGLWAEHEKAKYMIMFPLSPEDYYPYLDRLHQNTRCGKLLSVAEGTDETKKQELRDAMKPWLHLYLEEAPLFTRDLSRDVISMDEQMSFFAILLKRIEKPEITLPWIVEIVRHSQKARMAEGEGSVGSMNEDNVNKVLTCLIYTCAHEAEDVINTMNVNLNAKLDSSSATVQLTPTGQEWLRRFAAYEKEYNDYLINHFEENKMVASPSKKGALTKSSNMSLREQMERISHAGYDAPVIDEFKDMVVSCQIIAVAEKIVSEMKR